MLESVVSSAIFGVRNVKKTHDGHVGRSAVAVGQATRVVNYIKTLDNKIGRGTQTAIDALKTASKSESVFKGAGKIVDIASKNVNPLICVSAGIDVLRADDKEAAVITNSAALASMFAVEHAMKKHMHKVPEMNCFKGIAKKVLQFSKETKGAGKLPAIISGVAFVVGSCTAYGVGQNFGELLVGEPTTKATPTTTEA